MKLLRELVRLDYRYIYVLGNTRHLFRYKIGIAKNVHNRKKNIGNTLQGHTYEIFSAKFFFSRNIEQFMHGVYRPLNARMKGSGKTEWFWMVIPISPTIVLSVVWILQRIFVPVFICCLVYIFRNWDILVDLMVNGEW